MIRVLALPLLALLGIFLGGVVVVMGVLLLYVVDFVLVTIRNR